MAVAAGAEGDPPCSGAHDISFRAMVCVLIIMGLLLSTFSGATTGVLTALETNYGLSSSTLAWIVVCYDIGALVTAAPAGFYGATEIPRALGGCYVLAAAGIATFGMMATSAGLALTQFAAGATASVMWVLYPVHIDNTVHNKAVAIDYTGWPMSISPFGVIFGAVLAGGFLSDCSDESEGQNDCHTVNVSDLATNATLPPAEACDAWRVPFYIIAGVMLPLGVWFFFSKKLYRVPKNAKLCGTIEYDDVAGAARASPAKLDSQLDNVEKQGALGIGDFDTAAPESAMSWGAFKSGVRVLIRNKRLWWLSIAYAIHSFQSTAVVAFGPRYIQRQLCVRRATATLLTGTLVPVISIGVFLGGYIPKRCGWGIGHVRKPILMMAVTTLGAIPFGIVAFYTDSLALFLGCVMFSFGLMFNCLTPITTTCQRIVAEEHKGLSVGLVSLFGRLFGSIPGPLALGHWIDELEKDGHSPRLAYLFILGSCLFVAGVMLLWVYKLQIPYDAADAAAAATASAASEATSHAGGNTVAYTTSKELSSQPPASVTPLSAVSTLNTGTPQVRPMPVSLQGKGDEYTI